MAAREVPVVGKTDVVVVGGGPVGLSATVSAARNGVSVTFLERYPYLGGLASGGMVSEAGVDLRLHSWFSSTPSAQKMSRETPPCTAQGEAVGVAAALALGSSAKVRDVDVRQIQKKMRAQGADPGDRPSDNALIMEAAE